MRVPKRLTSPTSLTTGNGLSNLRRAELDGGRALGFPVAGSWSVTLPTPVELGSLVSGGGVMTTLVV
jgi:hypothetical protein